MHFSADPPEAGSIVMPTNTRHTEEDLMHPVGDQERIVRRSTIRMSIVSMPAEVDNARPTECEENTSNLI